MAEFPVWTRQAREHWKEHLPQKFAALQKAGQLEAALQEAASLTYSEVSQLEEAGMQPDEAFQMVREQYLFPRPEGTEPTPAGTPLMSEAMAAVRNGRRSLEA